VGDHFLFFFFFLKCLITWSASTDPLRSFRFSVVNWQVEIRRLRL
jgi:hypothetical protein